MDDVRDDTVLRARNSEGAIASFLRVNQKFHCGNSIISSDGFVRSFENLHIYVAFSLTISFKVSYELFNALDFFIFFLHA